MHEATAKGGHARFYRDFSKGFALKLPHVQMLREGARVLLLEAYARAHRGDITGLMESLRSLLLIGRALEQDPILVSQLVHIALYGLAIQTLTDLLPHVEFSDAQLAELQNLVRQPDFKASLKEGFLGERVIGIVTFDNPAGLGEGAPNLSGGNRYEDLALYLDLFARVIAALDESWLQGFQVSKQVEDELGNHQGSPINQLRYLLTVMVFPAISMTIQSGMRAEATRALGDSLIAVERYHRLEKTYPASLEKLVPKYLPTIPTDPFDGQPIRYQLRDGLPVVWSVGKDFVDSGGTGDWQGEPDLVLKLLPSSDDKDDEISPSP